MLSPSETRQYLNTTVDIQSDMMNAFIINNNIESHTDLKSKLKAKRGSNLPRINNLNISWFKSEKLKSLLHN